MPSIYLMSYHFKKYRYTVEDYWGCELARFPFKYRAKAYVKRHNLMYVTIRKEEN